jgi:hypothetical protein
MRVRDLSSYRGGVFPSHGPIELCARVRLTVPPGEPGTFVMVELDMAVALPDDHVALVFPSPALAALGLAATGPTFVSSTDPVRPLSILVRPPAAPVTLEPGQPIARLLLLQVNAGTLYQDPHLPIEVEPDPTDSPFFWPESGD